MKNVITVQANDNFYDIHFDLDKLDAMDPEKIRQLTNDLIESLQDYRDFRSELDIKNQEGRTVDNGGDFIRF